MDGFANDDDDGVDCDMRWLTAQVHTSTHTHALATR